MTETTTAASQGATGASGQAATAQQGATQQGQTPAQGGDGTTTTASTGQAQQGATTGSTQQAGTTTTTEATTAAAATAPVTYELRLPEASPLDQSDIEAVTALAKTHQWSNEQAQETLNEMGSTLSAQATRFRSELDADPEVGGARLEAAQLQAQRVLDRFLPSTTADGARLRSTLNKTGYGNFLPLVRFLARIGQAMGEDQPGTGGAGAAFSPQKRSPADRLFGDAQGIKPPS